MSVGGGWLLAPLVLALIVVGCGLLAERLAGRALPGPLIPAVGLAAVIVLAGLPALFDATAELAVPLVVVAAVAGLVLSAPWRDPRLRAAWPWPLLLAIGAAAVYAAPSLLTGQAAITGYVKLDDSATWLALVDHVLERGRDRSGVPPGSFARTLEAWLGGGYPVGAFLPLGVAARATGVDPAAAYQAVIALYAAILALGMLACVRSFVRARARAAGAAFVAVQASLLLGYANWGGIKEVAAAALLPPLAWLASATWRGDGTRSLGLLCLVTGGVVGVLGLNGLAWAGPALAVGAIGWWRSGERGARPAAIVAAVATVAALPALLTLDFVRHTTQGAISAQDDLGNLIKPLPILQGAGLWPVGDLRVDPDPRLLAVLPAVACVVGAAYAVMAAVRERAWPIVLLLGVALAGTVPAVIVGSPWVDAKALAILSPFVLLAAAAFVARLPRAIAAAGAVALATATAWSTQLVIRDVFVAPRERLGELQEVAERAAAPVVVLDFEIYAQRHFLRHLGADGATDLRQRRVARRDGTVFPALSTAEVDEIATPELWAFRSILRRRSPVASRPPAAFRRVWTGAAFELWERPADAPMPVTRLPLAQGLDPTAEPVCDEVQGLATAPGVGELAFVERRAPVIVDLQRATAPAGWKVGGGLVPVSDGRATLRVTVPAAGAWRVYVGGSTLGRLEVTVDGRRVGTKRHELAHTGQWLRYDALRLDRGQHAVELRYSAGPPQAGIGSPSTLGPLALAPEVSEGELPVARLPADQYERLCDGRRPDWVEALP